MNVITLRAWFPLFVVCNHLHHPVLTDQIQSTHLHTQLLSQHNKGTMTENLSHSINVSNLNAPLSITDALPIILRELDAEREHTNVKLTRIVESNGQMFKSLMSELSAVRKSCGQTDLDQLVKRVSNIELALNITDNEMKKNVEILDESIANANLRSVTSSMYLEQLLYNLKKGLFETLSSITKDRCCPCKSKPNSVPSPTIYNHSDELSCSLCKKTFDTTQLLSLHMAEHHHSQRYSCCLCGLTCRNSEVLQQHLETHHRIVHTANCPVCGHIFMNNNDLQSHLMLTMQFLVIFVEKYSKMSLPFTPT